MELGHIVNSTVLVAVSEMGDKTQLLAFALASRFRRPLVVLLGILLATLANHGLASTVGVWVAAEVPERVLGLLLAVLFIGFGVWTLRPDTLEQPTDRSLRGALLTTVVLFFLAEMGDKTQLATVALAARYRDAVAVTLGTTAGMLVADGLAVGLGERLARHAQHRLVRAGAAALFFAFGVASALGALGFR